MAIFQDTGTSFSTMIGFGDQTFTVIILLLTAGLTAHMRYGMGTRKAKELMIGLVLALAVGVQLYHLIFAAIYVPASRFHIFNTKLHRSDCLSSSKGGKRPFMGTETYDLNPCFCHSGSTCVSQTGSTVDVSACPTDGTATCIGNGTQVISPFLDFQRNCKGGQGSSCTKEQPCYPCERSTLYKWGIEARCRTCSDDFKGECNFVPDVGPYCYKEYGSYEVEPCVSCCTEKTPVFHSGKCY